MEVVIASSAIDGRVSGWDLQNGKVLLRYKSCSSPPHGLVSVGGRFLASSQLCDSSASSASLLYWSWHKPQPEVKSFPAEPINPLVSNREGTYLIGGGASGNIYVWEVHTGKLLKKWHAHLRSVSCLTLSDDESLVISGAQDGCVRVWSLFMMFDDNRREQSRHSYVHSFMQHTSHLTDVKIGHGGSNAVLISASEDRTCKIWSLATGRLLRNIIFPTAINAIALDAGEYVFYAGGSDGKIYIAALGAVSKTSSDHGTHIIGLLADTSREVTSLASGSDGVSLVSGSADGRVCIWDTRNQKLVRMITHGKGPVTSLIISKCPQSLLKAQTSHGRSNSLLMPPPLGKYASSGEEIMGAKVLLGCGVSPNPATSSYLMEDVMNNQINQFQQQGSATAAEMEVERLKQDCKRATQMVQKLKKMYDDLHQFCANKLVDDGPTTHNDDV
ncbi:hypothetical protein RND81_08G068000 [Saponaria officinalis]|uniref:Uncharacterized protein n=1 Tax=Saponaria officinalis TaxID=3572 RepID=A0AAW1J4X6_SAPOF